MGKIETLQTARKKYQDSRQKKDGEKVGSRESLENPVKELPPQQRLQNMKKTVGRYPCKGDAPACQKKKA